VPLRLAVAVLSEGAAVIKVDDLRKPGGGYKYTQEAPKGSGRFSAVVRIGHGDGAGTRWYGRATHRSRRLAAKDACDYLNGRSVHPLTYCYRRPDNHDFGARLPYIRPQTVVTPQQRAYMQDPRVLPKLEALTSIGVLYEFKGPHVSKRELDGWFGQEIIAREQGMKPHSLVVTHHIGRKRMAVYRKHGIFVYYYPVKWQA